MGEPGMGKETKLASVLQSIHGHGAFMGVFLLAAAFSYSLLHAADMVPELVMSNSEVTVASVGIEIAAAAPPAAPRTVVGDVPKRVVIDAVGVDVTIVNPESRDIGVLDRALLEGAVHYPGSGNLEDKSNMFLFGHSSYLPTVQNEAFRAFNGIQKLEKGEIIRVQSDGFEYRYAVNSVELVEADAALVELSNRERKLTLSTCNSFGDPGERFVVEADFVERVALAS